MQPGLGSERGKLTVLGHLLVNHAEAIEADLYPDVDLLDLYRPEADLNLRRVWVLVSGRLLVESASGLYPVPGTALARSLSGELGDWTRLELIVGSALDSKIPESKAVTQWKAAQQKRIQAVREARIRKRKEAAADE